MQRYARTLRIATRPRVFPLASLAPLASLVLLAPQSFAAPAVSLGPEVELAPWTVSAAGRSDQLPSIATSGTDYLVTWQDNGSAIHYSRVTAAGVVLDSPAIALAIAGAPAAYWDGSKYLVLGGTQGQQIDPASGVTSPPFTLAGTSGTPVLTFGLGHVLAVSSSASGPLQATLFDETGTAVHAAVALPSGSPSSGLSVAAGSGGGEFLVTWGGGGGAANAARISSTGALLDATPMSFAAAADAGAVAVGSAQLAVAGSPGGFLVSWYDARDTGVYAARVTAAGVVADPGGFAVLSGTWPRLPAEIVWTGTDWWATAAGSDHLQEYEQTIGADGSIGNASFYGFGNGTVALSVASGTRLAATSTTDATSVFGIDATLFGGNWAQTKLLVSTYLTPQTNVSVTASSRAYLASWSESGSTRGVRFRADGTAIDAVPIELGTTVYGATSTGYLLYLYGTGIALLPDGVDGVDPTDAGAVLLTSSVPSRGFACAPGECLSVGVSRSSDFQTYTWTETTLPLDGGAVGFAVVDTLVDSFASLQDPFTYASNGASFLFVRRGPKAIPIAADGTVGVGGYLGVSDYSADTLVWGTHEYMLISAVGSPVTGFHAYRLDSHGALVSGPQTIPLSAPFPAYYPPTPTAAWDGRGFFVVGQGASAPAALEISEDIVDGGADPAAFPLFAGRGSPSVASVPSAGALVLADQPRGAFATPRAVARWVTLTDAGVGDDSGDAGDAGTSLDADAGGDSGTSPDDASISDATIDQGDDGGDGPDTSAGADARADADATTSAGADASATSDGGGALGTSDSSGGCGCAVAVGAPNESGWSAFVGAVVFAIARRRRRAS